jgi:hypothetical protein
MPPLILAPLVKVREQRVDAALGALLQVPAGAQQQSTEVRGQRSAVLLNSNRSAQCATQLRWQ